MSELRAPETSALPMPLSTVQAIDRCEQLLQAVRKYPSCYLMNDIEEYPTDLNRIAKKLKDNLYQSPMGFTSDMRGVLSFAILEGFQNAKTISKRFERDIEPILSGWKKGEGANVQGDEEVAGELVTEDVAGVLGPMAESELLLTDDVVGVSRPVSEGELADDVAGVLGPVAESELALTDDVVGVFRPVSESELADNDVGVLGRVPENESVVTDDVVGGFGAVAEGELADDVVGVLGVSKSSSDEEVKCIKKFSPGLEEEIKFWRDFNDKKTDESIANPLVVGSTQPTFTFTEAEIVDQASNR